jgi:hypothetical protein
MRRFLIAGVVVALASVMLALTPAVARADSATVTRTITLNGVTSFPFTNPCTGEAGTATIYFTSVFVLVHRANDTYSLANETIGYFTLVNPTSTISGHFVRADTFAGGTNDVETIAFSAHGTASDGTAFTIQFVFHLNETGTGVTLSFDKCP